MRKSTHTRIYEDTLQNLRRIYAETGERMLDILDRLVDNELAKVKSKAAGGDPSTQDQAEPDA